MKRNILISTTHLTAIGYNNDNGTEFTTPLGRMVWGHPLKSQDKTKDGQKVLNKDGQTVQQWSFGVAFPKADFQSQIWPQLAAEIAKGYPNGAPGNFSYKYIDGDSADAPWFNGKQTTPYNQREGYPGNFILTFSTEFQVPECYVWENNAYRQIDESRIKTGDYVMVGTNAKWHAGQTPGLYVNPLTVLKMYDGDPLGGGTYSVDPNAAFGAAPPQAAMPAGARPVGTAAPSEGPGPGMPGTSGGMPGAPAAAPGGMPGAPSASSPAAASPSPAPTPPAPEQPSGPQRPTDPTHVHDNGNGTEQWLVNGAWDGGAHPVPAAPAAPGQMPPPATGFVDQAANGGGAAPGMPGAPAAGGGMPGQMPPR